MERTVEEEAVMGEEGTDVLVQKAEEEGLGEPRKRSRWPWWFICYHGQSS